MPRRPPKRWFYETLEAVKRAIRRGEIPKTYVERGKRKRTNPKAMVSWIWYHHMSPSAKRHALKLDGDRLIEAVRTHEAVGGNTMARKRRTRRKLSPAQKRALAKGRRALARKRAGKRRTTKRRRRRMSGGSQTLVLPEGVGMQGGRRRKRRSTRRRRRRYSGSAGVPATFGRRKRRRRRRRYYGGGLAPNVMKTLTEGAGIVGGAVLSSTLAARLTFVPEKVRPFTPILVGVALNSLRQTRNVAMLRNVGMGMIVAGGIGLVRKFAPGGAVPMLGDEESVLLPEEEAALLGYDPDDEEEDEELLGIPAQMGDDLEDDLEDLEDAGLMGQWVTSADQ